MLLHAPMLKDNTDMIYIRLEELPPFQITVEGIPLCQAKQYKYLGVTMDSQLNYNSHVQNVISRVSVKLKQFRRMRYFLNTKAAT